MIRAAGVRYGPLGRAAGFTLVELITVMILVGILAGVVLPRMFDRRDFDAVAFRDASRTLLRYAQKAAIAQRRTVCVHFTASEAWLTIRNAANDTACGAHASPGSPVPAGEALLSGPEGTVPFTVRAATGTGYSPVPAPCHFAASGRPSAGAAIAVIGSGAGSILVEAETGYVH